MKNPIIDSIRQTTHPIREWMEMFAEYDPDILTAWHEMAQKLMKHKELDLKTREFIIVAIDAVEAWPYIDVHIDQAFELGASIQELIEVMVVAGFVKGPHAWAWGLSHLSKMIQRRKEAGFATPRSRVDVTSDAERHRPIYP